MKFSLAAPTLLCCAITSMSSGTTHHHVAVILAYAPASFIPRNNRNRFSSSFLPPLKSTVLPVSLQQQQASELELLQQQQQQQQNVKKIQSPLTMLVESSGGMEELHELTGSRSSDQLGLAKQVRKSPSLFKLASMATIPLSVVLGFGLVPSRRIVAHGVGAVLTGIAGAVGKSKLDQFTESNAKPAIAQALINVAETTPLVDDPMVAQAAVLKVRDDFGLLDEDFNQLCTEIYSAYLLGMVKYSAVAKTSEIKELESLQTALGLDNLQVGEAHYQAAVDWYRQTCLFTPEEDLEDPDHPERKAMDKFLFLTERALSNETPEAFTFEMTRVAKAFKLSFFQAKDRVAETVEPFYQRALKSTRTKLGSQQVNAAMLERARKTLGVSEETARDMHIACYNEHVRSLLGLLKDSSATASDSDESSSSSTSSKMDYETMKFPDGAMEELNKLQDILGLTDTDTAYEIALEVTPLFQSTALAAMRQVLDKTMTPDNAWEVLDDRREELLLQDGSSKDLISSMVMQALGGPLEKTNKFAKVNNEAATYDNLLEALEAKEALISVLTKSGWDEFENFDQTFCNPWDKKSANGFLLSDERIKLYRIFLNRSIRKAETTSSDGKLTDDVFERIQQVQGLLGITAMQAEIESRAAFGPGLQKVLNTAMMEIVQDYTPELAKKMQERVDAVMTNYRLSDNFLREVGATFYSKAVALVSEQTPTGVPTQELSAALESLRTLFKLEKVDTYVSHMEYFGSVYRKSVLEAMGTTGVVRPEFRQPLQDLRERLGVSEENCQQLFLEAVEEKMAPMVEWIGSEMERTMLSQKKLAQRRGKDMGEDLFQSGKGANGVLGLGAEVNIMSDIMELIDFYRENDIIEESKDTDGETRMNYPVTALGLGAVDQELAELLYRQFIVGGFQTQGEKGARYEAARETFAGILGLEQSKVEQINNNIASTVYDNFVTNAMSTKGAMDQQDMMFLANIQTKLSLSAEEGEKLLLQTQKKILSEEIDTIMDNPSPRALKAFRDKCNTMGMDLAEDVGISKMRLTRMFESEIVPGLKSGEITANDSSILGEIQESIGLDAEECESMFETVLLRLSSGAMDLIESELLRGRDENTVGLIKELVRYAAFTDGDLGLNVEEALANQVVNIYEAFDFSGQDDDAVETNKGLLRVALGLSK